MASRIALLCVLGLLSASHVAMAKNFDFFYLVLMWPGAYCVQSGCCRPTTGLPAQDFFVSSFTPYSATSDSAVTKCNETPFYINQLSNLTSELYLYWSNIKCPSNNGKSTWRSAWKTYGVCSGYNETSYFQAALSLRDKVDVSSLLANKGIYPSYDLHTIADIKDAIAAGTGATPAVRCSVGPFGIYQLYQIYICVDKDASTIIECPVYPKFTCSDDILYHPYKDWMLNTTSNANPIKMPADME
ncbi:extracellular ribonuclease LE-like [Typha angustifolia]|uniref:extracellular ribonuclease LE-like n=1 Tax=Typha angustifolia TaxID=59011 RepID=UPI003C30D185